MLKYAKVLIIDDQPLAQIFLKQSLEKIGFELIQIAESAKHALRLAKETQFNLYICSFNLSRDRDGYHLFEELKSKGLVKLTTTFIFTSADTDAALVNSVVELQPDDFLVKPFTAKELNERLSRVLNRKQKLNKIYWALDSQDYAKALEHMDKALSDTNQSNLFPFIMRLKGDVLLADKQFEAAAQFYYEVLNLQKFTWAMVGLAKAYLGLNQETKAKQILEKLVRKPETKLAALDLLANYYIEHDEYEKALKQFKSASSLSPRNINRHKNVINLARLVHDHENQYEAAKTMAKFAKRSLHETPDLYLSVARAGIDYALTLTDNEAFSVIKQSERYLETLKEEFAQNPESKDQVTVVQARLHYLKDENEKAKQLIETVKQHSFTDNLEDCLDKAKAYHELGYQEEALIILNSIDELIEDNEIGNKVLQEYLNQEKQEKRDIPFSPKELNNMAVQFYNQKQLLPSIQAFSDAIRLMPNNHRIALNLFQALIEQNLRTPLAQEHTDLLAKVNKQLEQASLDDVQQERYDKLIERNKRIQR